MTNDQTQHIPVFAKELVTATISNANGVYVDVTVGGGGHLLSLLQQLNSGTVIGFDLNPVALKRVGELLQANGFVANEDYFEQGQKRVYLINDNFRNLGQVLSTLKIKQIDGLMADLGFSTDELSEVAGLSFRTDAAMLDMRIGNSTKTASEVIRTMNEKELQEMFMNYADLPFHQAHKLAQALILQAGTIQTVGDLNRAISAANIDGRSYMARIYQSLRIVVNDEYVALQTMLKDCWKYLAPSGRLAVITFHSGEERIVSEFIKQQDHKNIFATEYLRPSVSELRLNLKARSGKLFAIEKR
jgi:16S rRNA (cytosine1402-N4)-methyltransferase